MVFALSWLCHISVLLLNSSHFLFSTVLISSTYPRSYTTLHGQVPVFDLLKKPVGGRRLANAEGATLEAPQAPRGVGPTKESGERCELPQRGPRRSPGRKRIFSIFQSHRGPPAEQEIWAKLTRRAKAYSISSSVVIVSKIAYHLDSAHRDHNTHRRIGACGVGDGGASLWMI